MVQVRATDLDEGPNGEIIYSFSSHNAGVRELFSLDLVTGVLTVKGRLDFEDAKLHEIYTYRPKTKTPVPKEHTVKFW